MGDQYQGLLDPDVLEHVFVDILKGLGKRIPQLEIAEVNIKIVCCQSASYRMIGLRMIAGNPTVYVQVVASYVKVLKEYGSDEPVLKLIGGTNAILVCTCDNS